MADNPKQPYALPPLARKGAARPLAHARPDESAEADAAKEKRPSGLHTRPDLFGSSAVMPRPAHDLAEESDEAAPQQGSEDKANDPRGDPPSDAAGTAAPGVTAAPSVTAAPGVTAAAAPSQKDPATRVGGTSQADRTIGTPETSDQRGAEVGVFLPVTNLQDHPLRLPESISFEDWPDGPESEPEDGARSPEGASMGMKELETKEPQTDEPEPEESELGEPEPEEPEPDEPTPGELEPGELAFPDEPAEAAKEQDWTGLASEEDPGRPEGLLAWLETEGNVRRFIDNRWLLAAGAVSCAVLLLAGLAVGVIPLPGDDQESAQLAQDLDAPASIEARPAADDLAPSSEPSQQDIPVAPAGSAFGNDSPAGTQPDGSGVATGGRPDTSQLASLPGQRAPGTLDRDREPIVDFMRIDPEGKAVVAGRAAPGTELIVLDNGQPLGTITADIYGLWRFVSQEPLASGRHEIGLRVKRQGSEVSDPALVTEGGSPLPLEPDATAGIQDPVTGDPMTGDPDRRDLSGTQQLAAATPETPVQSDVSAPQAPAEQVGTAADDPTFALSTEQPAETAEAASPVPESAQPAEQEAGEADQTDRGAASPAAPAMATTTAPAPAPKPEPPEQIQTAAAVPAGGDYVIQFASFLNPDTAVREQALVEQRFSDLLAGHEIFVQQVDLAEQGTFYRVRLGPFASLADARAACTRFQERDRDCLAMAR